MTGEKKADAGGHRPQERSMNTVDCMQGAGESHPAIGADDYDFPPEFAEVGRQAGLAIVAKSMARAEGFQHPAMPAFWDEPRPPAVIEQAQANAAQLMQPTTTGQMNAAPMTTGRGIDFPPGLVGEAAQYIYHAAFRPVPEIALAAAITLMAGVCGRSYCTPFLDDGMNLYVVVLAKTGVGKEGATTGIDNLVSAIRPQFPTVDDFIGPAAFASGQGLLRTLDEKPCFVSVLGEFGKTLRQLTDARANSAERMLTKVLLDCYNKSGRNKVLRPMAYSDVVKNTGLIHAPSVTILGESTPEAFFDGLDVGNVEDGLIPRFIVIEFPGDVPESNWTPMLAPPQSLRDRFAALVAKAMTTRASIVRDTVAQTEDAKALLLAFEREARIATSSASGPAAQIWNRAFQNAARLASVVAVGCNYAAPVITPQIADWAIALVRRSVARLLQRFETGDVGHGDGKQFADLKRIVADYFKHDPATLERLKVDPRMAKDKIIPYRYFMQRAAALSSFKNDKQGATPAFKRAVQSMLDSGMLCEVGKMDLRSRYQYSGIAYGIGKHW